MGNPRNECRGQSVRGWVLAAFAGHAPLLQEFVSSQGSWWLWRSEAVWRARPVIAGAAILLAGGTWLLGWRALRRHRLAGLTIRAPLALAILLVPVFLYRDCLVAAWAAAILIMAFRRQ